MENQQMGIWREKNMIFTENIYPWIGLVLPLRDRVGSYQQTSEGIPQLTVDLETAIFYGFW